MKTEQKSAEDATVVGSDGDTESTGSVESTSWVEKTAGVEGEAKKGEAKKSAGSLQEQFEKLKDHAEHLKDQLLRAVAEQENIKRIMQRSADDGRDYAVTNFARDIVNSLDNLWRVLEDQTLSSTQREGVDITCRELEAALKRNGIERVDPLGQAFDYNFHQSVSEMVDDEKEAGTVIQVLQCGYTIKKRLLRPAMVIIAKKGN